MAERNEPSLGFQIPFFPVEVVPVAPPSGKPTIPVPVYDQPGHSDWVPDDRYSAKLQNKPGKVTSRPLTMRDRQVFWRAQKLARTSPWAVGFQIGWELGDYLFPNGAYLFPDDSMPVYSTGGHANLAWEYRRCSSGVADHYCSGDALTTHTGPPVSRAGNQACGTVLASCTDSRTSPALMPASVTRIRTHDGGFTSLVFESWSKHFVGFEKGPDVWIQGVPDAPTAYVAVPQVAPLSSEHPETFPMTWPMQHPHAQSWADAVPAKGSQAPRRFPRVVPVPVPMPTPPFPVVEVVPPSGTGNQPPTQVITIPPPGSGPPTFHTRPPSGRQRPRKNEREKKLSVRSVANKTWVALNLATEVFDFIDALHDALPEECQAKAASIDYGRKGGGHADPYGKAMAIFNAMKPGGPCSVDWNKAVNNYINQQVEDMVIGGLGMAASKAQGGVGSATGLGGAVTGRPSKLLQQAIDAENKKIDEWNSRPENANNQRAPLDPANMPIPVLSYDADRGTWTVEIPGYLTFR